MMLKTNRITLYVVRFDNFYPTLVSLNLKLNININFKFFFFFLFLRNYLLIYSLLLIDRLINWHIYFWFRWLIYSLQLDDRLMRWQIFIWFRWLNFYYARWLNDKFIWTRWLIYIHVNLYWIYLKISCSLFLYFVLSF